MILESLGRRHRLLAPALDGGERRRERQRELPLLTRATFPGPPPPFPPPRALTLRRPFCSSASMVAATASVRYDWLSSSRFLTVAASAPYDVWLAPSMPLLAAEGRGWEGGLTWR